MRWGSEVAAPAIGKEESVLPYPRSRGQQQALFHCDYLRGLLGLWGFTQSVPGHGHAPKPPAEQRRYCTFPSSTTPTLQILTIDLLHGDGLPSSYTQTCSRGMRQKRSARRSTRQPPQAARREYHGVPLKASKVSWKCTDASSARAGQEGRSVTLLIPEWSFSKILGARKDTSCRGALNGWHRNCRVAADAQLGCTAGIPIGAQKAWLRLPAPRKELQPA